MTISERQKLITRLDDELFDISHGPLAKFPLFNEVSHLTPGVLEAFPMPRAELRKAEQKLGTALVQMVKDGDWDSLTKVARTVGHFFDRPERPDQNFKNPERLREYETTLRFLRGHVDQDWTIKELQQHLHDETGVGQHEKTLKRWCEDYGFPIKAGESGRPKKS